MFQLWHRQLKPGQKVYAFLIQPVSDRGQLHVFCVEAEFWQGGKWGALAVIHLT